jgi:hypothetical protein
MVPKPPPRPPQPPSETEEKLEKFFDLAASKLTRGASRIQKNHLSSRRETRCSQDADPMDSPHPYLNQRKSSASENILHIADIPPAPPRPQKSPPKLTNAQIRLIRAVTVDKSSRLLFPFTFFLLNCTYWYMFYEYL